MYIFEQLSNLSMVTRRSLNNEQCSVGFYVRNVRNVIPKKLRRRDVTSNLWVPCGTRVTEPGVLGLEQHGGQSYGLYFIFLTFMYVLRCISLNINSQQSTGHMLTNRFRTFFQDFFAEFVYYRED